MLETLTPISQTKELKSIRPLELFYLFQKLNVRQNISIRLKRNNEEDFGNFYTVIRASNSLIMLRDQVTGEVEFMSEIRAVKGFILDKDCMPYAANFPYTVV
jgi:hypothetical protein